MVPRRASRGGLLLSRRPTLSKIGSDVTDISHRQAPARTFAVRYSHELGFGAIMVAACVFGAYGDHLSLGGYLTLGAVCNAAAYATVTRGAIL